jgi:hypothetical protein
MINLTTFTGKRIHFCLIFIGHSHLFCFSWVESVELVELNEWDWPFLSFPMSRKKFGFTANGVLRTEKVVRIQN